jgi:hypothetical protein
MDTSLHQTAESTDILAHEKNMSQGIQQGKLSTRRDPECLQDPHQLWTSSTTISKLPEDFGTVESPRQRYKSVGTPKPHCLLPALPNTSSQLKYSKGATVCAVVIADEFVFHDIQHCTWKPVKLKRPG